MDLLDRPAPRPAVTARVRGGWCGELVGRVAPNWFGAVMGTGIVANAWAGVGGGAAGAVLWVVAAGLLAVFAVAWAGQWALRPEVTRRHAGHPVMGQFLGAPPMALMTVGAGALVAGRELLGDVAGPAVAWPLWILGTGSGLVTAVVVPVRTAARRRSGQVEEAFAGWLMPVVPPVVSAACGALFLPHLDGRARTAMAVACLALLAVGGFGVATVAPGLLRRLATAGPGGAALVPTWWIVLGPLGQSATAVTALVRAFPGGTRLALGYALPVLGLALLCLVLVVAATVRAVRRGLPFSLSWWAFVFPLGTVVTGLAGVASVTGLPAFGDAATGLFAALLAIWAIVAIRTLRGLLPATIGRI